MTSPNDAAPIGCTLVVEARSVPPGRPTILVAVPLTVERVLTYERWASISRTLRIAQPDVAALTFWEDDDVQAFNDAEHGLVLDPNASTVRWQDAAPSEDQQRTMLQHLYALAHTLEPLADRGLEIVGTVVDVAPNPIGHVVFHLDIALPDEVAQYTSVPVPWPTLLGTQWLRTRKPRR